MSRWRGNDAEIVSVLPGGELLVTWLCLDCGGRREAQGLMEPAEVATWVSVWRRRHECSSSTSRTQSVEGNVGEPRKGRRKGPDSGASEGAI